MNAAKITGIILIVIGLAGFFTGGRRFVVKVELSLVKIRANKRIAALNVDIKVGQHALVKQPHLAVQ